MVDYYNLNCHCGAYTLFGKSFPNTHSQPVSKKSTLNPPDGPPLPLHALLACSPLCRPFAVPPLCNVGTFLAQSLLETRTCCLLPSPSGERTIGAKALTTSASSPKEALNTSLRSEWWCLAQTWLDQVAQKVNERFAFEPLPPPPTTSSLNPCQSGEGSGLS